MPDETLHPELRRWLEVATKGLFIGAKLRLEQEMSAHYRETVAEQHTEGSTDEEAHQQAMHVLGNPKKARRAFRRAYLTEREAELLALMANKESTTTSRRYALAIAFAIAMFLSFAVVDRGRASLPIVSAGSLTVIYLVQAVLKPQLIGEDKWRRARVWHVVLFAAVVLAPFAMFLSAGPKRQELGARLLRRVTAPGIEQLCLCVLGAAFFLCFLHVLLCEIRLIRKLSKYTDFSADWLPGNDDKLGPV